MLRAPPGQPENGQNPRRRRVNNGPERGFDRAEKGFGPLGGSLPAIIPGFDCRIAGLWRVEGLFKPWWGVSSGAWLQGFGGVVCGLAK